MKHCNRCNRDLDEAAFSKSASLPSGLMHRCKECDKACQKAYRDSRPGWTAARLRKRTRTAKDRYNKKTAEHRRSAAYKARRREYALSYYRSNVEARLGKVMRESIRNRLKGRKKAARTWDYLGCTPAQLRLHLESLFLPGMTWANYGYDGWHIDHIRPLCSFDLTDETQLKQASNYTNLQPLWAPDNLHKGSSYKETEDETSRIPVL